MNIPQAFNVVKGVIVEAGVPYVNGWDRYDELTRGDYGPYEAELFAQLVLPHETACHWVANPFVGKVPGKRIWTESGDWRALDKAAVAASKRGHTSYFCTAGVAYDNAFIDPQTGQSKRSHGDQFVIAKRCLHVDIDVGKDGYVETQGQALDSLRKLCADLKIPQPSLVVSSGYGLHCYWSFDADLLDLDHWQRLSDGLLAGAVEHAPELTADTSKWTTRGALLRWPGTSNYKGGGRRPVEVWWGDSTLEAHPLRAFSSLLKLAPVVAKAGTSVAVNAPTQGLLGTAEFGVLARALAAQSADSNQDWFQVRAALCRRVDGAPADDVELARCVFEAWASTSPKFDAAACAGEWARGPERGAPARRQMGTYIAKARGLNAAGLAERDTRVLAMITYLHTLGGVTGVAELIAELELPVAPASLDELEWPLKTPKEAMAAMTILARNYFPANVAGKFRFVKFSDDGTFDLGPVVS